MSPLLDCYNGEIISLAMDTNMKKELCIKTITEAYKNFDIKSGAIILKRLRKPVYKRRVQKDARTAACRPEYERSWQMFLKMQQLKKLQFLKTIAFSCATSAHIIRDVCAKQTRSVFKRYHLYRLK